MLDNELKTGVLPKRSPSGIEYESNDDKLIGRNALRMSD